MPTLDLSDDCICNLGRTHGGMVFVWGENGWDFDIFFFLFIKIARTISIPKIGNVAKFLSFTTSELGDSGPSEEFTQAVGDLGWGNEKVFGGLSIAIVLGHGREKYFGMALSIESVEVFCFECLA